MPRKQLLHPSRAIFEGLAVATAKTDTGQAADPFSERIADCHGGQHRHHRQCLAIFHQEVNQNNGPWEHQHSDETGAADGKAVRLSLNIAGNQARRRQGAGEHDAHQQRRGAR